MESNNKYSFFFLCLLLFLNVVCAKVHYHEFVLREKEVKKSCNTSTIITVNGQFPGPTLEANNGDSFVIKVVNLVRYNVTIHWHGVRQMRNGWADGPTYVTQCPIQYGGTYTYRFDLENQEGTFWWHAHNPLLRVTVYGALIVYPKESTSYPFTKPQREIPIILGEWWIENYIQLVETAFATGQIPHVCDALLINGQPSDLHQCSNQETTVIPATAGETVLLRFINAAMVTSLFVSVAGHTMTVVAADASYTKPFNTSYLMLTPGQTTAALVRTDRLHGRYYIAARAFSSSSPPTPFCRSTATAILDYDGRADSPPLSPILPAHADGASAAAFSSKLRSPSRVEIPEPVDENLRIAVGFGLEGRKLFAHMNSISFAIPGTSSILQAAMSDQRGVFTADFPSSPPEGLSRAARGTKIYKMKYGSVVQVVVQGSKGVVAEDHPIHLHGYDFYLLGTGIGEFDEEADEGKLNVVDPPARSTVGVPAAGWAVIRFVADNPGVWLMHCHVDAHMEMGMAMGFWVENGDGEMESVRPPPDDLPLC